MLKTLRHTWFILDRSARNRLLLTAPVSLGVAIIELIGLAHISAFVQLVTDRDEVRVTDTVAVHVYRLVGEPPTDEFIRLLGAIVLIAFVVRSLFSVLLIRWQLGIITQTEAVLAARVYGGYLSAPYVFLLTRNSAELLRNVQVALERFTINVVLGFVTMMSEGLLVFTVIALLFIFEPVIAAFMILFLGIATAAFASATHRFAARAGSEDHSLALSVQRALQDGLFGYKSLRVTDREEYYADHYRDARMEWSVVRRRTFFLGMLPRYYLEVVLVLGVLVVTLWALQEGSGPEAIGAVSLFVAAGFRVVPSLVRMLSAVGNVRVGGAHAETLSEEMATLERMETGPPGTSHPAGELPPLRHGLELEGVSFRYPGADVLAVADVSLTVGTGESVGIVGKSGAGKSTLVDVVLGLLPPSAGRLLVDGWELKPDDGPAWRRQIGYVPQEIYLVDDSLRRNIAFGIPDAKIDDERVHEALRLAHLVDLLDELPEGLDTLMGERGTRISGGQRQRVGIARALYSRPRLLVLDEATSALDPVTEAGIVALLDEIAAELTVIVVAHRLSTVKRCDRLYLLSHGRIEASGTFDELRGLSDAFDHAVRLSALEGTDT